MVPGATDVFHRGLQTKPAMWQVAREGREGGRLGGGDLMFSRLWTSMKIFGCADHVLDGTARLQLYSVEAKQVGISKKLSTE